MEEFNKVALDFDGEFYIDEGLVWNNGRIDLVIPDHDKEHTKTLDDVKFCPYCGRKL